MMTYKETLDWMFQQLPMYQRQGSKAYRNDLKNIHLLMDYLAHPYQSYKTIHVAGTNGKGSTSHLIASVLQEAGYKTGLYTSPHLIDFRERVKIDGKEISESEVVNFIDSHKDFFEKHQLSFFEMTVGLAFESFKKNKVDIAVVEVGMGGRLDATNVIVPEVSVITNIGLDHTQFLGDTLPKIAREKAGIVKEKVPLVIGEYGQEYNSVLESIANDRSAAIHKAYLIDEVPLSSLKGNAQIHNSKTAFKTIEVLQELGFQIGLSHIEKGFEQVTINTGLRGRWEVFKQNPQVILNTAHNKEGLAYAKEQFEKHNDTSWHFVLGFVNDKDISTLLDFFPKNGKYYICTPQIPRALKLLDLEKCMQDKGLSFISYSSVYEAYKSALHFAQKKDMIYVGGSTFVVADFLQKK